MSIEKFRNLSEDELKKELASHRKEQFNLRFRKASNELENTARVRVVRRDIARLKTLLAQKAKG